MPSITLKKKKVDRQKKQGNVIHLQETSQSVETLEMIQKDKLAANDSKIDIINLFKD